MARTTITNNSGERRSFGYIPPHGVTLDDAEDVTVDGDLRTVLAGGRNRYSRKTELQALDTDVAEGTILYTETADPSSSSASA
jgi:hypothetical protein